MFNKFYEIVFEPLHTRMGYVHLDLPFFHWKSVFDANAQAEKMYITMKINFI